MCQTRRKKRRQKEEEGLSCRKGKALQYKPGTPAFVHARGPDRRHRKTAQLTVAARDAAALKPASMMTTDRTRNCGRSAG
jgi:hypothetical protein